MTTTTTITTRRWGSVDDNNEMGKRMTIGGGMAEWRSGGLVDWWNGGIGMAEMNGGMAEMAELESRRGNGEMAEWRNGWQNGGMAGMATYLPHLWYTPTTPTPTPFNLTILPLLKQLKWVTI